ncbi:hypothetical protein ABB07_18605 [Streptomyces incarnatus]|uniref:DUF4365 domain-containing protein n=1 Tax=Streptomyces incarnatus TaxID=665007 RepID=A0ABM5TLQ1_9ACTN|nr:hypothetical protein [Streptomyces incarnatus]AKJ11971.1 hypothetical protein ABB07_18605 [Streptomyces incarnatus]
MVTSTHEASHRIFQDRPEILTPVFDLLGVPMSAKASVAVLSADVTEIQPLERRVDTVLRVEPSDGDHFLLAIETQLKRDERKATSWPYYVTYLREKFCLPVLLLVTCTDRRTARWATGPFTCEVRGWTTHRTHPLVLGPDNVPKITDQRTAARNPAMAVFSAITHGRDPEAPAILEATAGALKAMGDSQAAGHLGGLLEIGLGDTPARETWRELMGFTNFFPGRGTMFEEVYLDGKAEGKAEGEARAILRFLEARGIPVPEEAHERIASCTDLDLLGRWLDRTPHVQCVHDLFADEPEDTETASA